jgi:hypothetical protein
MVHAFATRARCVVLSFAVVTTGALIEIHSASAQGRGSIIGRVAPRRPILREPRPPILESEWRWNREGERTPAVDDLSPRGLNYELIHARESAASPWRPQTGFERIRNSDIAREAGREFDSYRTARRRFTATDEQHITLHGQCGCLGDKLDKILEEGGVTPGERPATYTTTTDFIELARLRKQEPHVLHLHVTSPDQRGLASLSDTATAVKVLTHALPTSRAEAIALHGATQGARVPLPALGRFSKALKARGSLVAPTRTGAPLRTQLLEAIRAQPERTAIVIPGHIVSGELRLPDGTSIPLGDLTAANPNVVIAFAGCNSATAPVAGSAVIGTGARITYTEAIKFTTTLESTLPKMPLATALQRLQATGPYIGLVGLAFVLMIEDPDRKKKHE